MGDDDEVDIRVETSGWDAALQEDAAAFARRVIAAAARAEGRAGGVAVLLSDDAHIRALNAQWRGKDKPTNVLSFPAPSSQDAHLGDIVLALETVTAEAKAQAKPVAAHAAHLLTHGFLHLIGYDHETDDEAARMETRERELLTALGYSDPYAAERER